MEARSLRLPVFSLEREQVGEVELSGHIADQPMREHLLYEVVKMQLANRRAGTASTKTRGEVSGGGKKPWRQKGAGRARAGSSRSPLWEGGAVVFGPRPRSYAYRMPRSARRTALCAALALKQREGTLVVVDRVTLRTSPILERTNHRHPHKLPTTHIAVTTYKPRKVAGSLKEKPKRVLKSVRPLVPPRFNSLRLNINQAAKAMACVRIAK